MTTQPTLNNGQPARAGQRVQLRGPDGITATGTVTAVDTLFGNVFIKWDHTHSGGWHPSTDCYPAEDLAPVPSHAQPRLVVTITVTHDNNVLVIANGRQTITVIELDEHDTNWDTTDMLRATPLLDHIAQRIDTELLDRR